MRAHLDSSLQAVQPTKMGEALNVVTDCYLLATGELKLSPQKPLCHFHLCPRSHMASNCLKGGKPVHRAGAERLFLHQIRTTKVQRSLAHFSAVVVKA